MNKLKKFFETPKKAILSSICIVAILIVAGAGTVFAVESVARSTAIGAGNAQNYAFADAGVDPASATIEKTEFEFEDGTFVYDISFYANGGEYEYLVRAKDGVILKKESDLPGNGGNTGAVTAGAITEDEAKNIALNDAGISSDAVTFTKVEMDQKDGRSVYDLTFYTETTEYEYEIYADNGAIYSKSKEGTSVPVSGEVQQETTQQTAQQEQQTAAGQITVEEAKDIALADAGVAAADATFYEEKLDYDDGVAVYDISFYTATSDYDYEIHAETGEIRSRGAEGHDTGRDGTAGNVGTSTYIGVDEAKTIAANHAGVAVTDVVFSKAKLENDDGRTAYEIEFYYNTTEYEYKISASTGEILEFDSDRMD